MDKPIIFKQGSYSKQDIEQLSHDRPIWKKIDLFPLQAEELMETELRERKSDSGTKIDSERELKMDNISIRGDWVYFPWNGVLIHIVPEADLFRLRTNRNQLLITKEEQAAIYNQSVGFAGLSIGSSYAVSLAYSGIGKNMSLADMDTLSTSNLNRVKARLAEVGEAKSEIIAQQIYEINPHQQLKVFANGLNRDNIDRFMGEEPHTKLGLIFEAVDDFALKILIRLKAREYRIPVIMLTNLADSILIDIERYDIQSDLLPFNDRLNQATLKEVAAKGVARENILNYIIELLDVENLTTPILNSLEQVGKTLVGRPQLFSSVSIGGGIASYLARQVFLKQPLQSGRYKLSLDTIHNIDRSDDLLKREDLISRLFERR